MTTMIGKTTSASHLYEQVWHANEATTTNSKKDTITVGVVVVTKDPAFFQTGLGVLNDIRDYVFKRVQISAEIPLKLSALAQSELYSEAKEKAIHFLRNQKKTINIEVIQCASLAEATGRIIHANALAEHPEFQVGMVFYDQTSLGYTDDKIDQIDRDLDAFYRAMHKVGIPAFYSTFSTVTFIRDLRTPIRYLPQQYREIVRSEDPGTFQTELLCLWMDFFEMNYTNRRVKPTGCAEPHNTLGEELIKFFGRTAPGNWLVSYFTGSVVSNLIGHLDRHASTQGGLVLRGQNEHAIACGAIANWQLYRKPFLAVVTSGMLDEFKGTLINLKETAAQGIIVAAENRLSQWYSFQGTITATEDTRQVFEARGIPYVYMDEVENMTADLARAFELFHQGKGPVVILATQNVLESSLPLDKAIEEFIPEVIENEQVAPQSDALKQAIDLVNNGPEKLVWQLGPVTEDEYALVHEIAEQAGIALVDTLAHPGSVPKYYQGKRNPHFLGTLAIYGYTPKVYHFFHTNDKLNELSEQSLFMIKSRVAQVATPFSDARLERKVHVIQVTHNERHLSPYADVQVNMNCLAFLQAIKDNLNVSDELKAKRVANIHSYVDSQSDVISKLPTLPMSPNYFFSQLNGVVESLIEQEGFDYTGVYDVGRCGISAVRNVAKTRRGFSGWYGRALMGDALLASTYLAFTSNTNVIAFIGDGAKGIVPDILPSFIDNILSHPELLDKSITVFYFCNGGLSVINTYQERILFNRTSRQMRLVNIDQPEYSLDVGDFTVQNKTLTRFDETSIREALTSKRRLNLFSVVLGHNNEGDGMSLATAKGWQRDPGDLAELEARRAQAQLSETQHSPTFEDSTQQGVSL